MTEKAIQKEVAKYLRKKECLFTSTAGGVAYKAHQLKLMKDMGYHNGIPDLVVYNWHPQYRALFIELKTPTGRLSYAQAVTGKALAENGYLVTVAHSVEDAKTIIDLYLGQANAALEEVRRMQSVSVPSPEETEEE